MVLPLKVSVNRSVGSGLWTWTQAFTDQRIGETMSLYFRTETKGGSFFLSDGEGFKIQAARCTVLWERVL
jgi:hypothetical protein